MRKQEVLSAPAREFVGSYTTKSGQKKNRYKKRKGVRVVKSIKHIK
mgnify:CR=1 FL=1